jgi:hypothetical protein
MEIKRKLQLGAAAAILNGVIALIALSPATALADSCQTHLGGCTVLAQCLSNPTAWCQSLQPGCTVTSATCYGPYTLCPGNLYSCSYNP